MVILSKVNTGCLYMHLLLRLLVHPFVFLSFSIENQKFNLELYNYLMLKVSWYTLQKNTVYGIKIEFGIHPYVYGTVVLYAVVTWEHL